MKAEKKIWVDGPIAPQKVADSLASHASKTNIGAHAMFLGQIRADEINGKTVRAIEYSAYRELADTGMAEIRAAIFSKYELTCMHVYHSLGVVAAGEICLFVFTSAPHRKTALEACEEVVERIKKELPIWGREIFEDDTHQWKVNT